VFTDYDPKLPDGNFKDDVSLQITKLPIMSCGRCRFRELSILSSLAVTIAYPDGPPCYNGHI